MTTLEFFNNFISPACHKRAHNVDEYKVVKSRPNAVLVKATTLYQIYQHNVFGADGHRLTVKEFFRVAGQYLYYDKYICVHGTEFYYHVEFNPDNMFYTLTKDIVDDRVRLNGPSTLTDLDYVVEAVTRYEYPTKEDK